MSYMRVVLTALLMLATIPAWAEWVSTSDSTQAVYYLDLAIVRKDDNLRKVWELTDLKAREPKGELSYRTLIEYDCKEGRSRHLSISAHAGPMATGKALFSGSAPGKWDYAAPGTAAGATLSLVCAR